MGLAYLPDGRIMKYDQYLRTPEWKQKKANRLAFDNWQCGICHKPIEEGDRYETHHLRYNRLGHEDVETDLISLCPSCHQRFHSFWEKANYWENSSPLEHWKEYSLPDTAQFCFENLGNDMLLGGEYNLCSDDVIDDFIDDFYRDHEITDPVYICETDIKLFFRNKRYEVLFEAQKNGEKLDNMLDRLYGKKGSVKSGPNKLRSGARSFFKKHQPSAMKRIYKENKNILILIDEVNRLKGEKENA